MRTINIPLILINLQDDGFHLLVEIVVFGEKVYAVVDTGASRSVFDKALLEKHLIDLLEHTETQAATLFSTATTLQGTIPKFKIGKLTLKNYSTVGLDLQGVSQAYSQYGHPAISAIIGGDILTEFNAKIDYRLKVMRLYR